MKIRLLVLIALLFVYAQKIAAQCGTLDVQLVNSTGTSSFLACDGIVEVSVTGGTPNYSFFWFPGSSAWQDTINLIQSGLCQGAHKLYVRDSINCIDTLDYFITGPSNPCLNFSLNVSKQNATSSSNCDGTATYHVLGAALPIQVSSSVSFTDSNSVGICSGAQYVTVMDNNGCSLTVNFNINYPGSCNEFFQDVIITNVSAPGSCDGSLVANTIGGTPPFTYTWYEYGNPISISNAQSITNLCSGNYSLEISDSLGCIKGATYTVGCPGILVTTISTNNSWTNSCDGSVTPTVTGGVLPYSYFWSSGLNDPVLNNLCSGNYTVTVTDANGCNASASTVVSNPLFPTPCDGFSIAVGVDVPATDQNTCDMVLNAHAFNGTAPYSYYWEPTGFMEAIDLNACPISGILYSCTVTDSRGCTVTQSTNSYTNAYVETIPLDPDSTTRACGGSATAYGYSGVPPYTFTWDNGETTSTATNLCEGLHAVYFADDVNYLDTSLVVIANEQNTFLYNQNLAVGNYVYITPEANCTINYANIDGIYIDSHQIIGPNKVKIIWQVHHTSSASDYITKVYTVVPNSVVEFIIGLYCESGSNYYTARDRIDFNPIVTSINSSLNLKESIVIYPNPFKNEFTISTDKINSNLIITDVLGRQLYSTLLTSMLTKVDAQNFSSGVCFVNIINGTTIIRCKIIKSN